MSLNTIHPSMKGHTKRKKIRTAQRECIIRFDFNGSWQENDEDERTHVKR